MINKILTPPTCPSSSSAWLPRRSATSSPSSPRCCRCSASTPPRNITRTTSTRTPTATATCHWASSSSPAAPSHHDKTIQHWGIALDVALYKKSKILSRKLPKRLFTVQKKSPKSPRCCSRLIT